MNHISTLLKIPVEKWAIEKYRWGPASMPLAGRGVRSAGIKGAASLTSRGRSTTSQPIILRMTTMGLLVGGLVAMNLAFSH